RKGAEVGVAVYRADEYTECCVSSTAVRRAIEAGDVGAAALMLGREYTLSGKVVHGRALGRTIGFPTANIDQTSTPCIVPARGVYAVDIILPDGGVHRAIMNIGHRPTVDNGSDDTLEVHVLDYNGDLYGQTVVVKFLKRLRDERKFGSVELLREQLAADASAARTL
ncbi:MAG: riboflavin biosynthesis protein RibF, partial [Muribaculum sp.]|nr:riboflavin biosynthesis protein RibF [Muribaculum sp.]